MVGYHAEKQILLSSISIVTYFESWYMFVLQLNAFNRGEFFKGGEIFRD